MEMLESFKSKQKISENKLKAHRTDTASCQRDLKRDRLELDRKEQSMLAQIKVHANRGEMNKAKILAHQVAKYRELSDRNFKASTTIEAQAQLMLSNYRIQEGKLKAMGGKAFSHKQLLKEQFKMSLRLEEYGMIETMLNDGNDDEEDEYDNSGTISSIIHTACNSKPNYSSAIQKQNPNRKGLSVVVRMADASQTELVVEVDSLEISGDMLKRLITNDAFIMQKLGLNDLERYGKQVGVKALHFGLMNDEGNFMSFNASESLLSIGIQNGHTILLSVG